MRNNLAQIRNKILCFLCLLGGIFAFLFSYDLSVTVFLILLGLSVCLYGMWENYKIYNSPLFPLVYRIWEIFIYPPAFIGLILSLLYINFVLRTDFLKLNSLFGGLLLTTLILENFLNTKYDDSQQQIQELRETYEE